LKGLKNCSSELLIECPFIASPATTSPTKLKERKVRVVINTRDRHEHDEGYHRDEAYRAIASLQRMGVQMLYPVVIIASLSSLTERFCMKEV
jgi:hypothetical protein